MITLREFVVESNAIESIVGAHDREIESYKTFLKWPTIDLGDVSIFVAAINGGPLRLRPGMDVKVGSHIPMPGGNKVVEHTMNLIRHINAVVRPHEEAFDCHCHFAYLHPYMDGNGRAARAIWLRMMGGVTNVTRGFLHTFYYQTLQNKDHEYGRKYDSLQV